MGMRYNLLPTKSLVELEESVIEYENAFQSTIM